MAITEIYEVAHEQIENDKIKIEEINGDISLGLVVKVWNSI